MEKNWIHIISAVIVGGILLSCSEENMEKPVVEYDLSLTAEIAGMQEDDTKATLFDKEDEIRDKTLTLYGWDGSTYWIKGSSVTYNTTTKKWDVAGSERIKNDGSYTFLSYANMPLEGATITTPDTKDGDITYKVTDITKAQNDVLLGKYQITKATSGDVNLNFTHPYASVRFTFGNTSGITTIKAISLDGVYSKGTTTYNISSSEYTWSDCGAASATLSKSGLTKKEKDTIETFVVIPQDLGTNNVMLTVTYDDSKTMQTMISEGKWEAGKTTTYTLNKIGSIDVSILGTTVTNGGNTKSYVRAAITGAWYDASGNIVAPWLSTDGTFSGLWSEKAADGYYYYKNALTTSAPGNSASVYTSYNRTASPPVTGATLKLDILVQAIPYDINKTCQEAFAAL